MSYAHKAGSAGTVTVPAKSWVHSYTATAAAGGPDGSLVITQANGAAQEAIPVPAGGGIEFKFPASLTERPEKLGEGSTLVFAGTDRYFVVFA